MADFENVEFSPILIMEFIRQVTAGRVMTADNPDLKVSFKIKKAYYDEMKAYPLQVQFINLVSEYDDLSEVVWRVQSDYCTGFNDKGYYGK